MTTEVQIRKDRRYLSHLRKIVACIAARLGMSSADITKVEDAVSEVCASSMDRAGGESDQNLSIRLDTRGTCLTVEITDPCVDFDPVCSGLGLDPFRSTVGLARTAAFADNVELTHGDEGTTIRLTKYAERLRPPCAVDLQVVQPPAQSPTVSSQV